MTYLPCKVRPLLLLCLLTLLSLSAHAQRGKVKLKYPKPDARQVFDSVAQPAVPLGGTRAYAQFLADKQRYPGKALQQGLQGTVPVSFIIEKSGDISEVKVVTPLGPELDAEALRLVKSAPKWTPARHRGQVVRQRVTIPVSFVMSPGSRVVTRPAKDGPAASAPANSDPDPDGPVTVAPDKPTRPVGGEQAFFDWIEKNQQYPALARRRKIQGRVMVEFMVQPDGTLTDARVMKKMGSGLDEEALRLIKTAPKWEPASYKGRPLKQKMVLPVIFQL